MNNYVQKITNINLITKHRTEYYDSCKKGGCETKQKKRTFKVNLKKK